MSVFQKLQDRLHLPFPDPRANSLLKIFDGPAAILHIQVV